LSYLLFITELEKFLRDRLLDVTGKVGGCKADRSVGPLGCSRQSLPSGWSITSYNENPSDTDRQSFLPHPFSSLFANHPTIWRSKIWTAINVL